MGIKFRRGNINRAVNSDNVIDITGYSVDELISFVGIDPTDVNWYTISEKYPVVQITIQTNLLDMQRIFNFQNGTIINYQIEMNDKNDCYKGTGTSIIAAQVRNAYNVGFKKITLFAARIKKTYVGYYVWGVMGFTMATDAITEFANFKKKYNRKENDLEELLSTQKGKDFWFKNGFPWYGEFDLNPNSHNNQILNEYKKKYGL